MCERRRLSAKTEEFVEVELRDSGAIQGVVEGVDAVVHLGGIASEETWETIRDVNIDGAYNVFESARRSGVKRVVYASSVHAVDFYPRSRKIDSEVTVLPDSPYGVSKAFGEALGTLYTRRPVALPAGKRRPPCALPGWRPC